MRSERVALIGPSRRDAEVTREILNASGIECTVQSSPTDPRHYVTEGFGALIFTEHAISHQGVDALLARMESQRDWSALPIVLLCRNGHESPLVTRALELLENVTILDRPCSKRALVSAVKSALRVRRSQTQIQSQIRALTQAEAELRQADSRKDQFLATLAHELRNPLAPIRSGLDILAHQSAAGGRNDPVLGIIDRQMDLLVRLVDELLDVSRISTGKVALRRAAFDLRASVDAAIESCLPALLGAGHVLSRDVPDQPLTVDGDATRIAQAIANLLGNAVKYSPRGGRIAVTLKREGAQAVVRVDDSGVGIPTEMLQRVFDVFVQVESSRNQAQGGLGIGLSLVRSLVELHGGSVSAESSGIGSGSRFEIRLPVMDVPAAAVPPPVLPEEATAPDVSRDVLVVDDNREAADALGMLMELAGHKVRVAYDARAALREMASSPADAVFCDIGMPEMDGFAFARAIRGDPRAEWTALIALTGWGSDEFKQRARDAGFDLHITKPVDARSIAVVLANSVERRALGLRPES